MEARANRVTTFVVRNCCNQTPFHITLYQLKKLLHLHRVQSVVFRNFIHHFVSVCITLDSEMDDITAIDE